MVVCILFVNKWIGCRKLFRILVKKVDGGNVKGGLVIFVGERYVDKILDVGVDIKNVFLWLKVVIEIGVMGVVNVYVGYFFVKRVKIWRRMLIFMDCLFFWILGGDWNFVER